MIQTEPYSLDQQWESRKPPIRNQAPAPHQTAQRSIRIQLCHYAEKRHHCHRETLPPYKVRYIHILLNNGKPPSPPTLPPYSGRSAFTLPYVHLEGEVPYRLTGIGIGNAYSPYLNPFFEFGFPWWTPPAVYVQRRIQPSSATNFWKIVENGFQSFEYTFTRMFVSLALIFGIQHSGFFATGADDGNRTRVISLED